MGKRFLIGQLAKFGDCLYATTIAKQIKHDYPDSHLTWAVASEYKSVLELNPYIDSIWEISVAERDYCHAGWQAFVAAALQRQAKGEFDEIIFSQIVPNWLSFNGTIRGAHLSAYPNPITVSVEPVVRLSQQEIENVRLFAQSNNVHNFKQVILFECAATSGQSDVTPEFALEVAQAVTAHNPSVCFILSMPQSLPFAHPQILDASGLTFKENAELTHYCTLLVGCSSGITWLATSDWAKKLPMLQLLKRDSNFFAGVHYDFAVNGLDNKHIVEMTAFDGARVVACINSMLQVGPEKTAAVFHQSYLPDYENMKRMLNMALGQKKGFRQTWAFIQTYLAKNPHLQREMSAGRYLYLFIYIHYYHLRYADNFVSQGFKKFVKAVFSKHFNPALKGQA